MQGPGYHHGSFRRFNFFSAASSALETAVAAYEHNIDHRDWSDFVPWSSITWRAWSTRIKEWISRLQKEVWHHCNLLVSLAHVKLDHRHVHLFVHFTWTSSNVGVSNSVQSMKVTIYDDIVPCQSPDIRTPINQLGAIYSTKRCQLPRVRRMLMPAMVPSPRYEVRRWPRFF